MLKEIFKKVACPSTSINEVDFDRVVKKLKERVIGQDRAIDSVANTLVSQKDENSNQVYLFVGPSGVGKTELAKSISLMKSNRFASFEMSKYFGEHGYSTLIGAPIGLVGSCSRPFFAEKIFPFAKKKTRALGSKMEFVVENTVVLFDEMEKAHQKIKNRLLSKFLISPLNCKSLR